MSFNLYAKVDGEEIDLYQTPTVITNMILVNSSGSVSCLKGKKAKRALYSYIEWCLINQKDSFEHCEEIRLRLITGTNFEVYTV